MIRPQYRPWLAGVLSLLLPGLGQFYIGLLRRAAAAFLLLLTVGNGALAALAFVDWRPYNVFLSVALVLCVQAMIITDAVRSAKFNPNGKPPARWNRPHVYVGMPLAGWIGVKFTVPVWGGYEGFSMPAGSMEDTLLVGDHFWVEKCRFGYYTPQVNDVIVFYYPLDASVKYVKRCVAVAGQTVEIRAKQLLVDGQAIPLPEHAKFVDYETSRIVAEVKSRDHMPLVRVPPDKLFVLGDNRDRSSDSRFWGFVPVANVVGKAVRIYWSSDFDRVGLTVK